MGDVYVWGYGILGLGPEVKKVSQPTLIPPVLFGKNLYEKNTKVRKRFCRLIRSRQLIAYFDYR